MIVFVARYVKFYLSPTVLEYTRSVLNFILTPALHVSIHAFVMAVNVNQVEPSIPMFLLVSDQDHVLTTRN